MKKKVLLMALLLLVAVGIGVLNPSGGQSEAKPIVTQRLYGVGKDGAISLDVSNQTYGILLNLIVTNPDTTYDKTLEKVVIRDGDDGTVIMEVPLSFSLGPREIFERDFEQLDVPDPVPTFSYKNYVVEFFWNGQGLPLLGYMQEVCFPIAQDQNGVWYMSGLVGTEEREMVNYSS